MANKNGKKYQMTAYTLWANKFVEITLSRTISKINVF